MTLSVHRGARQPQLALLTAKTKGRGEVCLVNQTVRTCKHNKVEAYTQACTCTHGPTGKALTQLTEDQGHTQLTQGQLCIVAAPGPISGTHDTSPQAVRLICHVLHHSKLNSMRPNRAVGSESSSSRVSCSNGQVDFYEEVTAETWGGLQGEVKRTRLLAVVSERMRKKERSKRGETDIGRVQATAVVWMKNDKNGPVWMNSG